MVLDAKGGGFMPLRHLLSQVMFVDHPDQWFTCGDCYGKNVDQPECR